MKNTHLSLPDVLSFAPSVGLLTRSVTVVICPSEFVVVRVWVRKSGVETRLLPTEFVVVTTIWLVNVDLRDISDKH